MNRRTPKAAGGACQELPPAAQCKERMRPPSSVLRREPMDILLVDDDAGLRRTIRLALETMGHRVSEARDGAQALDLLNYQLFDLALLDLRLGGERGTDLLPELLRRAPGLNVVIITAYATVQTAVEAMRRGAFDYLPKPFTPEQLRLVLERAARA